MRNLILATALAFAVASTPLMAQEFNDKQKEQIENIVRELLTKKEPSIVMKAAQEQSKAERVEEEKKSAESFSKNKDKIVNDPNDPVIGNPKGDVTIVEFFDYNCGYCKKALPTVQKLLEEDKNVRFVFKEYPILSDTSRVAAKAALAANKQNKYMEMHVALMDHKGGYSENAVAELAKKIGLDVDKFKKDMASDEIAKHLEEDQNLGMEIGAHGTPTFIIGNKIVPGAMELEEFKGLVAEARKGTN
jgi:protein-disulfide isomerase